MPLPSSSTLDGFSPVMLAAEMLAVALLAGLSITARAQAPSEDAEHAPRSAGWNGDAEEDVPAYELPDPLTTRDGHTVQASEQWMEYRRPEVLELFRSEVYGRRPGSPEALHFEVLEEDPEAMGGAATLQKISVQSRVDDRKHTFELIVFVPNAATEPVPLFLLLNNRDPDNTDPTRTVQSDFWPAEDVIDRGYGIAALQNDELAPDAPDRFTEGVIELFEGAAADERSHEGWGALAAWGWGASRAMDYFETAPRIDAARVGVVGHSRGGKAALWAGAEDERFKLVVSNNSGCGGAALSRRRVGETVRQINERFPHWFCENFARYNDNESALPVDQHMLISLIAPRAVYITSADEDLWADPRGEFLSLAHASPVYALWGHAPIDPEAMPALDAPLHAGPRGYHIRSGGHNLTAYDWHRFMDLADALWTRGDL